MDHPLKSCGLSYVNLLGSRASFSIYKTAGNSQSKMFMMKLDLNPWGKEVAHKGEIQLLTLKKAMLVRPMNLTIIKISEALQEKE
jgi:hypothetical protein